MFQKETAMKKVSGQRIGFIQSALCCAVQLSKAS